MCNSFINRFSALALACACLAAWCAGAAVHEVRIASASFKATGSSVTVAGLQSAVTNGYPWVSLAFCDRMGGASTWPGAERWKLDYAPIALHQFNPELNYQRYFGAHFWKAVCLSNAYEMMGDAGPAFTPGDASGYFVVSNLSVTTASRVYAFSSYGDGAFVYNDQNEPHWLVWTTNAGATYCSGWPWANVAIGTNDTYTFAGMPTRWAIATQAARVRLDADFALIPGERGVLESFYVALTETTEATAAAVVSNGVELGLCAAGDYTPLAGRGAGYPDTGRTLGETLALCNLATRLHNAVTGEALTPVYTLDGSAFWTPVADAERVKRVATATGYRIPTQAEYALASAGDAKTPFPWGSADSHEWFVATNGLPVTESLFTEEDEVRAFYLKYQTVSTNSTANFVTRNGVRHVSPGRVSAVRSQFQGWSIPAVNATTGLPVTIFMGGMSIALFFGSATSDGAWGEGVRQVHDLAGNVSEMTWPPVARPWGGVRVCLMGGSPALDAGFARSDARAWCSAARGRSTVGFRFARNKVEVLP